MGMIEIRSESDNEKKDDFYSPALLDAANLHVIHM